MELTALQLPGREQRFMEETISDWAALLEPLARAVGPLSSVPLVLYGHSLGAWVGFELARRLQAEGTAPAHLFVSSQRPPHRNDCVILMRDLPDDRFVTEIDRLFGPNEYLADPEMRELFLPILRADIALCEVYQDCGGPPLSCGISVFGGRADPSVPSGELDEWGNHTKGPFECTLIDTDHLGVLTSPEVLQSIKRALNRLIEPGD